MSTSSLLLRVLLAGSFGLTGLVAVGCDDVFTLENSRARMTWLSVIPDAAATTATVHFWVQDLEGDGVDLTFAWTSAGGPATPIVQAAPKHPLIGTVTRDAIGAPNGQEHRLVWDLSAVPAGPLQLVVTANSTPRDAKTDEGADTWLSPEFDPRAGLTPAARWELRP